MKRLLNRLLSYLPTKLPVGMTAYTNWVNSIIQLAGPMADEDSMRFVISNQVMHLPLNTKRISKQKFVTILRKYAANELAAHTCNEVKQRQVERVAAQEQAKKQLEDTTKLESVSSNENQEKTS